MNDYPASGILFQNDRKQNDRQPDYTGNLDVDRETVVDLWNQLQEGNEKPKANLVGWRKTSKAGRPFLSLRSSVLMERKGDSTTSNGSSYQGNANSNQQNLDDEIPF